MTGHRDEAQRTPLAEVIAEQVHEVTPACQHQYDEDYQECRHLGFIIADYLLASSWLQRHDAVMAAEARREAAQDIAAAIEARKPHIPVSTDPQRRTRIIQRSTLNQAAALARAAAAAPPRPDTQQGDGDG